MTAGEFVYLIRADKSQLNKTLGESERDVKSTGERISAWTVAKGQMIGQFATKAIMKVNDITSAVVKNTIKAYGTFEQLEGGARLLFGSGYDYIMEKSKTAFRDVQMSTNDYLNAVNGYAVGLKNSLGGDEQAAAELADRIITAQADVVAATGRSREAVQNAFAGLMRGNFMMIDNLGLGLKGSKEGMQEVIDTVNEWNAANGKATKYQMGNLADMQNALIDYIEKEGLAGYAGKEAADTIEGTMASTKAAWNDLLVAFGSGKDVKVATRNLTDSAKKLLKNMLPVAKNTIQSIGDFVVEIIPEIGKWVSELSTELKNSDNPIVQWIGNGIEEIQTLINGASNLILHFPETVEELKNSDDPFASLLGGALDTGYKALQWINEHKNEVAEAIKIIGGAFLGWKISNTVMDAIDTIKRWTGNGGNPTQPTAPTVPTTPTTPKTPGGGIWDKLKTGVPALASKAGDFLLTAGLPAAYMAGLAGIATFGLGANLNAQQLMKEAQEQGKKDLADYQKKHEQFAGNPMSAMWETLKNYYTETGNPEDPHAIDDFAKHYMAWFNDNVNDPVLDKITEAMSEEQFDNFHEVMADIEGALKNGTNYDFSSPENRERLLSAVDDAIKTLETMMTAEPAEIPTEPKVDLEAIQTQLNTRTYGVSVMPQISLPWNKHAKGLWSVPYDNYPALLHRDEQVLTASQARHRNSGGDVDYGYISQMIGDSLERAMNRVNVLLDGGKVGDMTSRRTGKNIRRRDAAVLHGMGG